MIPGSRLIDGELEALLLGSILRGGETAFREVRFLDVDDFAIDRHRIIIRAIAEIADEVSPTVDAVAHRLIELGKIEAVGGLSGLMDVHERGFPDISLARFGLSLRGKAVDRRAYSLTEKLGQVLEMGYTANAGEADTIIEQLRALRSGVEMDPQARTFGECLEDVGGIQELCSPPRNLVSLAWSNTPVKGFQPGQLIIGAGPTGAGKTILGAQQAAHAAKHGHRTLFISLEMSNSEMLRRFLSLVAHVRHADLQEGTLNHDDRLRVINAAEQLSSWPLEITNATRSIDSIHSKVVRERKREQPYRLVVIDYLQLINVRERLDNRVQEVSLISRSLKEVASENECVVLALSQLSRAPASRTGDHEPRLSDLRDSGSIEQDADIVIFVHRPGFYKPADATLRYVVKLIVGKNRNGPIGSTELVWVPKYVMFAEPDSSGTARG